MKKLLLLFIAFSPLCTKADEGGVLQSFKKGMGSLWYHCAGQSYAGSKLDKESGKIAFDKMSGTGLIAATANNPETTIFALATLIGIGGTIYHKRKLSEMGNKQLTEERYHQYKKQETIVRCLKIGTGLAAVGWVSLLTWNQYKNN